ncbi:hypothetical protein FB45DRAFT_942487 [Roridomyces roridus]|uniref:Uncharacterized protein n=1 Tax=Roridomyces roridus TaxID=1738132 RepID=A0AAD7B5I8_9AGAR|nr:hypothetical protein FB45DRAFT_942487 [Roridomyces roridus]
MLASRLLCPKTTCPRLLVIESGVTLLLALENTRTKNPSVVQALQQASNMFSKLRNAANYGQLQRSLLRKRKPWKASSLTAPPAEFIDGLQRSERGVADRGLAIDPRT